MLHLPMLKTYFVGDAKLFDHVHVFKHSDGRCAGVLGVQFHVVKLMAAKTGNN